jgi:hypothetical protein
MLACASPEPTWLRKCSSQIQGRLQPDPISSPLEPAMGVQVSKELRSRLEHSTLEELLANDKVISFKLLENPAG